MKSQALILVVSVGLGLSGCATNPFKKYYHDKTDGKPIPVASVETPRLVTGTDPMKDSESMLEDGYQMLGYSSFVGPIASQSEATAQGEELHADIVIVFANYSSTVSGVIPITTPTTQTTYSSANATAYGSGGWANASSSGTSTTYGSQTNYVPYSVDHYNQGAQFWVKGKPSVFGTRVRDLTTEKRREIASNKGVEIAIVVKGSPAFIADLMKGDIIRKLNDRDVTLAKDFSELVQSFAGQSVKVEGIRNGIAFKKTVLFNQQR